MFIHKVTIVHIFIIHMYIFFLYKVVVLVLVNEMKQYTNISFLTLTQKTNLSISDTK